MKRSEYMTYLVLIVLSSLVYFGFDYLIQLTGFLKFSPIVGLKNFLPATYGLFWGPYGVFGSCLGTAISGFMLGTDPVALLAECLCNIVMGLGIYELIHMFSGSHRVTFKRVRHYVRYTGYILILSVVSGLITYTLVSPLVGLEALLSYFFLSVLVGIPVNILFGSLLCVQTIIPSRYTIKPDAVLEVTSDPKSIGTASEIIEETAMRRRQSMKRVFEVQNCLEELYLRVFKYFPDTTIHVRADYSDSVSLRISYECSPFNPFKKTEDDDEMDMMGLNLLRHRALRASSNYQYLSGENRIHIVL